MDHTTSVVFAGLKKKTVLPLSLILLPLLLLLLLLKCHYSLGLEGTFGEYDGMLAKQKLEIQKLNTRRCEDLDLYEKTLESIQEHKGKRIKGYEDNIHKINVELRALKGRGDQTEVHVLEVKKSLEELQERVGRQQADYTHKFETVKTILNSFGDALKLPMPTPLEVA